LTQQLTRTTLLLYQLDWTIIRNKTEASFISSDNPSSVLPRRPLSLGLIRFLPLAPDMALLAVVDPTTKRSTELPDLEKTPPGRLRRAQIRFQVAVINPLMHVKGYAAPETKAAVERARQLIEQSEALGEPPEDPLLLFSVLYSSWAVKFLAFNGDALRELAVQFLALAEKQRATVPLMIGHRLMGNSLLLTGDIARSRGHYDQALALYDPAAHRSLVTRFGQDVRVSLLFFRSWGLWLLGYPEAALADVYDALKDAREIGDAVEAAEQLTRAVDQIAALPTSSSLRRAQIRFQVAVINPLMHIKGYAAPETKAAVERARQLIEQSEALGEPPEDQLLLSSVLYSSWAAKFLAFDGDALRELAVQFLALAEKQRTTVPLMIGHRLMGNSLLLTGDIARGRGHYDKALALYDPAAHRSLVTRFGQDVRVSLLFFRSWGLWLLGYPEAALADVDDALKDAREIGDAATLMYALNWTSWTHIHCGNHAAANAAANELVALADEKAAVMWKALGMVRQGLVLALTGKASDAVQTITAGLTTLRSTGATQFVPAFLSYLARAYAELGKFDDAWHCVGDAMTMVEATKERWQEAEVNRTFGEIALLSAQSDAAKAEAYFERALAVARAQQAKSWELRAATSMALDRCGGDAGHR
jgi:tetratricopeptide (TPR) repeat protein